MDMVTLEVAHSVLGRTGAPPVVRDERSHRDSVSVTPAQFHDKLRQLEEEKDHIILSAHQHNCPDTVQSSQLIMADTLTPHLHDRQNNLPLLDLNQFDRDFPLLFLANVCESVQAYH
ncbi:hypothetical protein P3T76_010669 [Phytophthora citrophthora]|uniref:Uncharacterized protein n=1 Tax=Phytophthora citrophthora TaxID=4793 RepID=A0AAD9GBQ3_9STRA|nr:hypothetical protein P3T76_010669 [Phytophthora citrophthora]